MGRPLKVDKLRDKEATKRKLIEAVSTILKSEGYLGLGVNKVAKQAGVNKKLIYKYFGTLNNLTETYITERDFWLVLSQNITKRLTEQPPGSEADFISSVLEEELKFFYHELEMQQIIRWQISEKNPFLRSISNVRENMASDILAKTDDHFAGSNINFRAICALIVGGIYYTVFHAKTNGSTVCGVDMNKEEDRNEMVKSIRHIITWAFTHATVHHPGK